MTKEELIRLLKKLQTDNNDIEQAHVDADILLLQYINDPEIKNEYDKIYKWYA